MVYHSNPGFFLCPQLVSLSIVQATAVSDDCLIKDLLLLIL